MKKLLITVIIILLIVLAYFAMYRGISLGSINILSVQQIIDENDKLTASIDNANALLKREYPAKKEELSKSVKELLNKKEEYFSIAKISTEGEITKANTEETYLIEYLWTRIGRHATSRGINLKMNVNSGNVENSNLKNLAFTAKGQYSKVIQFISDLEGDEKLNFKIENFKMLKENNELTATFNVKNVRIKTETLNNKTDESTNSEDVKKEENQTNEIAQNSEKQETNNNSNSNFLQ